MKKTILSINLREKLLFVFGLFVFMLLGSSTASAQQFVTPTEALNRLESDYAAQKAILSNQTECTDAYSLTAREMEYLSHLTIVIANNKTNPNAVYEAVTSVWPIGKSNFACSPLTPTPGSMTLSGNDGQAIQNLKAKVTNRLKK